MRVAALIFALIGGLIALGMGLVGGCVAMLGASFEEYARDVGVGDTGELAQTSAQVGLMSLAILGGFVLGIVGGGMSLKNPKAGGILLLAATVLTFLGGFRFAGVLFLIAALLDFLSIWTKKE